MITITRKEVVQIKMDTVKQEKIVKKKLEQFLVNNFPPYNEIKYITVSPEYNKVELIYSRNDSMIIEVGIGEGSMYKLLSTNFR